jgi:hypothetical protein
MAVAKVLRAKEGRLLNDFMRCSYQWFFFFSHRHGKPTSVIEEYGKTASSGSVKNWKS